MAINLGSRKINPNLILNRYLIGKVSIFKFLSGYNLTF